jgi:low temperature requirement protein LtrA
VLLCAVFTVWLLTTFEATYFDITRRQTQIAVLAAMVLGLFMNAAIGVAFGAGGWAFVIPLVVTEVARSIITFTTAPKASADARHHPGLAPDTSKNIDLAARVHAVKLADDTPRRGAHRRP